MTSTQRPLRLTVRDLLGRPGQMREHVLEAPLREDLGAGLVSVTEGTPLQVDVRLESVHEGILVTAEATTVASGECGRCLTEIALPVEVEIQELFAYSAEEAYEHRVHDDHVDLEPVLRDAVVLSLPFQPVCSPDCPGLDPETGLRLAETPGSTSREVLDPRWSALAKFQASEDTSAEGTS